MRSILFSFGPFHLYSYGFTIVLGVMLSLFLMEKQIKREPLYDKNALYDMVFVAVMSGLLGARIYYVIQGFSWYKEHPLSIFAVWEGGLIFYGGLIGSTIALLLFFRSKKIEALQGFDFLIPYVALCQTFGRIGCFLNGCCFGSHCDLPWAVSFPEGPTHVHPAQIYESLYTLALFFLLSKFYPKRQFPGQIFALYFVFYGFGRLVIEFFRDGNPMWLFFTWNQWISVAVILAGSILFSVQKSRHSGNIHGS